MSNDLLELVNKGLIVVDSNHSYINSGGCGVFAALIYPHLERLSLNPVIRAIGYYFKPRNIDEERDNILSNAQDPLDKYNWSIDASHYLIEVNILGNSYYLDSEGVYSESKLKSKGWKVAEGSYTYEEMKAFAESRNGWNTYFDRSQIPSIQQQVDDFFTQELTQYKEVA